MIYNVSPQGNDAFPGTEDQPVKTLARALELTRQEREKQAGESLQTIIVREGLYEDVSVTLDERDSGLTIRADGEAVLSGGRKVQGWSECGDGTYRVKLPPDLPADFRMLTVNGNLRERARFPAEGRLKHRSKFRSGWLGVTDGGFEIKPTPEQLITLEYEPADIAAGFDWQNAELTIFHRWDETLAVIGAHDASKHTFRFREELAYPPGAFESETYIIWNTAEGMTKGKWRVDKQERFLYYKALDGEDMLRAQLIVPVHQSIIKIQGGISRLTVEGLSFTAAYTPLVNCGFGAVEMPGAIDAEIKGSLTDCLFTDLRFTALSGWGIKLSAGKKTAWEIALQKQKEELAAHEDSAWVKKELPPPTVIIENCEVTDTGGGGIQINDINDCLIKSNRVTRAGRIYYSAIAICASHSSNCRIIANVLTDLPYTAICAGWGCDNFRIIGNKVYNAVNVLNDGGGIYVTGGDDGEITGNTVYGVLQKYEEPDTSRNGIYLDERTLRCVVEGNLVCGCPSAMMNHMSKGNIIRNNVFVCREETVMLSFIRCQSYVLERNTVHARDELTFAHRRDAFARFEENLLYSGLDRIESVLVADDYTRGKPQIFKPFI